jgi:anti-anti-sigma factor
MTSAMTATTRSLGGGTTVFVSGEIDMSNSPELADAVDSALRERPGPLTVDLQGVQYLDSAGIHVLLARADRIDVVTSPLLLPVLRICGLTEVTTVVCAEP